MTTRKTGRLTRLIESEMQRAEVVLAAKSISNTLQKMAEQVAKIEADDVMPMMDSLREAFGQQVADQFEKTVIQQIGSMTETLRGARDGIGAEIGRMEGIIEGKPADDMSNFGDDDAAPEMGGDMADMGMSDDDAAKDDAEEDVGEHVEDHSAPHPDADTGPVEQRGKKEDQGFNLEDEMFGDDGSAAGRAPRNESFLKTTKNPDQHLLEAFTALVKAGVKPAVAGEKLAERYDIDVADVKAAIKEAKKAKPKAEDKDDNKSPCWDGYHKEGTKKKGGKTVNNCVPDEKKSVEKPKAK